jgi:hypothetical protein
LERALPTWVQKREPECAGLSTCGYVGVPGAVLEVAFPQLMAGDQGNYWKYLRHQRKINPIVMLFKGFVNSTAGYGSRGKLMIAIVTRMLRQSWHTRAIRCRSMCRNCHRTLSITPPNSNGIVWPRRTRPERRARPGLLQDASGRRFRRVLDAWLSCTSVGLTAKKTLFDFVLALPSDGGDRYTS